MKKKSPRGIPDFAPKKKFVGKQPINVDPNKPAPPPPQPTVKPPATSMKGGRRGQ